MRRIKVNPDRYRIEIIFPFSLGLVQRVKELPDRKYDGEQKIWFLPLTNTHASYAHRFGQDHGFTIDRSVFTLLRSPQKKVDLSVRDKLYPFQVEGLNFLHNSGSRAILADEMGLGKTITTLSWMQESQLNRVLIIAPASVIYNWEVEINKWLGWPVQVVSSGSSVITTARIVIMSYQMMVNKLEEILDHSFDLSVFDECHYLGNNQSKRTIAATRLNTPNVLGLSGTPFLNRPMELFPLLHIISPSTWSNRFKFGVRYCDGHKNYFGWDFKGASNLPELKERIKYIFARRIKSEVLKDLPPMTRTILPVYISEMQEYKNELDYVRQHRVSGGKLVQLTKLRQIIGQGKISFAVELAKDVLSSKPKVVLFAHHKSVIRGLEIGLKKFGVCKIVGDTDKQERQSLVEAFSKSDSPYRVMLISLAGGEGINLQSADTLIFVEREWNPGKEGQIEGRVHRIGQDNPVQIIYLLAKATIDERIHKLIESKREVIGKIISLDDIPLEEILEV